MKRLTIGVLICVAAAVGVFGTFALESLFSRTDSQLTSEWRYDFTKKGNDYFYPRYLPSSCNDVLASFDQGKLQLDDTNPTVIGSSPSWEDTGLQSDYFRFYLHSLRFVTCLIDAGNSGDLVRLEQAKLIIFSWLCGCFYG